MKHRSPLAVFFLSLLTLGIYTIVWQVKTKGELKRLGADIPTSWLLIVPFASIYWIWKYSVGVEKVTSGKISAVMTLLLLLLLGIVGMAILQSLFNKPENFQFVAAGPGVAPNPGFATPVAAVPPIDQSAPMPAQSPVTLPPQPITNPMPPQQSADSPLPSQPPATPPIV